MNNFTDVEAVRKIDPQDTLGSTEQLAKQCQVAWQEVHALDLTPFESSGILQIIFCGMGASMYGGLVVKSLLGAHAPYPVEVISDYNLPAYVGSQTLVVLTSYSGSTEEVLSCADQAKARDAKMIIITKGGKLADFARQHNLPAYIFDAKLNPAGVPRLANGYTILGLIAMLNKLRIIDFEEKEIADALVRLQVKKDELKNKAKIDYEKFSGKIPVLIAAEHLHGNAHITRNQFHETSKSFATYFLVPDLNHHLMEGLQFPLKAPLQFISLESANYSPKIQKRFSLTKDVIKQNNHELYSFVTSGATVYDDFLEALIYGSYLTLYLGLHYDQNPAINPWVDYFKKNLA
jgi:glucose/mannose-6-phosphate isomerase